MIGILKKKNFLGVAGLCLFLLSGCFAVATGTASGIGTYNYVKGELCTSESVSFNEAWRATLKTVDELEFKVVKEKDAMSAEVICRRYNDQKVSITLTRVSEVVTEFKIRVGTFGDEATSRMIFEKIKSYL